MSVRGTTALAKRRLTKSIAQNMLTVARIGRIIVLRSIPSSHFVCFIPRADNGDPTGIGLLQQSISAFGNRTRFEPQYFVVCPDFDRLWRSGLGDHDHAADDQQVFKQMNTIDRTSMVYEFIRTRQTGLGIR